MKRITPGYIMYIVFYPCDTCESMYERQYTTEAQHRQAIMDMYEVIDAGGYCVVSRFNTSETIRNKQQLWEFKF